MFTKKLMTKALASWQSKAKRSNAVKTKKQALADLARDILANVAVVGIGLALYEQKWWCFIIAAISTGTAGYIAWRSHD